MFWLSEDLHSKSCNKVSATVAKIEGSQLFDQINFKLEKILQAMDSISISMKSSRPFMIIHCNIFKDANQEYRFYRRTKMEDSNILANLIKITRQIFSFSNFRFPSEKSLKWSMLSVMRTSKKSKAWSSNFKLSARGLTVLRAFSFIWSEWKQLLKKSTGTCNRMK